MPFDIYIKKNALEPMAMHASKIHVEGHTPKAEEAVDYPLVLLQKGTYL